MTNIVVRFVSRWRLWIRPVVMTFYAIVIVVLLPLIIGNAIKNGFDAKDQSTLVGGVFVMMALPISFWDITQHLVYYTKPYLQKHIVRVLWMVPIYALNAGAVDGANIRAERGKVLWMVPIYALNAWVGLAFPSLSIYFDSLRECYEAYVIYNFMIYLLNYLERECDVTLEDKPQVHHIFPLCFLSPWDVGEEFTHTCKHGILQYTVVRPLTTAVSFICEMNGVYGEGEFRGNVAFPYMIAVNNLSQFVAMYCLVLFYRANRRELAPMKPIGKFLCIKAVVFFSFFQGMVITILVYSGVISSAFGAKDNENIKDISSKIQDFLICIEMFLAAVAHHFTFSHRPYIDVTSSPQRSCCQSFLHMWDVSDVQRDIKEHFGVVGSSLSRRIRGQGSYQRVSQADERSKLLGSDSEAGSSRSRVGSSLSEEVQTYHSVADGTPVPECIGREELPAVAIVQDEGPSTSHHYPT